MHAWRISLAVLALAASATMAVAADKHDEKHKDHESAKDAGFEKIKTLQGTWGAKPIATEHGPMAGTVSYRVTAGGSAVTETMFAGTDHEMITMYYVDGDGLALTHYCVLGNRPMMRAEPGESAKKLVFKCNDRENAALMSEDHMHQATYNFVDADHVKTEWVLYKDGKPEGSHVFELTRKKK